MKKVVLFILLSGLIQAAYAVKVKSIYEAEVPVAVQEEQPKAQAIQQAFAQTLVKVSGSHNILQNPIIKAALPQAKREMEEFGYLPSEDPSKPFLLKVRFDPKAVQELLRQAKAPIWGEDRPLILVWLAVDSAAHTTELMDSNSNNEFAVFLKDRSHQRGVPLLLPVMDVTDLSQVSVADVHAMSVLPLQKAAERYHTDGILIGNIQQEGKIRHSHWKLVLGKDQWEWNLDGSLSPVVVESLIDKMTSVLGGRYAAVLTENTASDFTLVVKGVSQQDDFDNLMHFIKRMSLIKDLQIENIRGDEVSLHLAVQGTQQAFMQDAAVGQHLQLQQESQNELTYLWMR